MTPQTSVESNKGQEESSLQPIVDEICEKTRLQLEKSDLFTHEHVEKVSNLLAGNREALKPVDILKALSDPEPARESHEDS